MEIYLWIPRVYWYLRPGEERYLFWNLDSPSFLYVYFFSKKLYRFEDLLTEEFFKKKEGFHLFLFLEKEYPFAPRFQRNESAEKKPHESSKRT